MNIGFDISTTNIGICVLDNDGNLVDLKHIQLKTDKHINEEYRLFAKAKMFLDYLKNTPSLNPTNLESIYIEKFLGGSNNQNTNNLLLRFNAICSYILHDYYSILPNLYSVNHVRKVVLPEYVEEDFVYVKNDKFNAYTRKYNIPKDLKTPQDKYNYLKTNYPDLQHEKPMQKCLRSILRVPKDKDIKELVLLKMGKLFNIDWMKDKKGNILKTNYDMSDAAALCYAGMVIEGKTNNLSINNISDEQEKQKK